MCLVINYLSHNLQIGYKKSTNVLLIGHQFKQGESGGNGFRFYHYKLPYKWIYWRVEYLANRSIIIVGVTLILRKAVTVAIMHINSYKTILALFNFGEQTKNCQTTKLKSLPNIPRIQYLPITVKVSSLLRTRY